MNPYMHGSLSRRKNNIKIERRMLRKLYGPKQIKDFKLRLRSNEKDFSKLSIEMGRKD